MLKLIRQSVDNGCIGGEHLSPLPGSDPACRRRKLGQLSYDDYSVVMCGKESQARGALQRVGQVMKRLGLDLRTNKTMVDLRQESESSCFWGVRSERSAP
jgi:hypothetical protein